MQLQLPPPLLALSPGDLGATDGPQFIARLGRAVGAGLRGLLLREPALEDRAFLELARSARKVLTDADETSAWLGLHDRAHLVRAAGAGGLHLGFRSLRPADLPRELLGRAAIGLSTHAADATEEWACVDYLFHGPVHPTPSKRGRVEAIGMDGLAEGVARAPVSVWALGGLGPEDVAAALDAGARGVAAISAVWSAGDPAHAVTAFLEALEREGLRA